MVGWSDVHAENRTDVVGGISSELRMLIFVDGTY